MSNPFTVALVINTYEQPAYLTRVLRAVAGQVSPPDEVVLADDGSGEETRRVFADWSGSQEIRCAHAWQEHAGFRRSRVLNLAIAQGTADYLVFLDGDTVPHPRFVADHREVAEQRFFVQGHRALIEQRGAETFGLGEFGPDRRAVLLGFQMRGLKHAFRWPAALRKIRADLHGIRGCNLGIWRQDLVAVNGYNEAFEGWGREDSELAVRLMNHGVRRLDIRGRCLCYHLWHPPSDRGQVPRNDSLLEEARRGRARRCDRGLDQHMSIAS